MFCLLIGCLYAWVCVSVGVWCDVVWCFVVVCVCLVCCVSKSLSALFSVSGDWFYLAVILMLLYARVIFFN